MCQFVDLRRFREVEIHCRSRAVRTAAVRNLAEAIGAAHIPTESGAGERNGESGAGPDDARRAPGFLQLEPWRAPELATHGLAPYGTR